MQDRLSIDGNSDIRKADAAALGETAEGTELLGTVVKAPERKLASDMVAELVHTSYEKAAQIDSAEVSNQIIVTFETELQHEKRDVLASCGKVEQSAGNIDSAVVSHPIVVTFEKELQREKRDVLASCGKAKQRTELQHAKGAVHVPAEKWNREKGT